MTSSEIWWNIRYHEDLIGSYQYSIRQLENQIYQLQHLRGKFQNLQTNLVNKQVMRKNKLSNVFNSTLSLSMVRKYANGMQELLNGFEYSNAYNGLIQGQERINWKINTIQNEISSYNNKIAYSRNCIIYWQNQMQYAEDLVANKEN